MADHAPKKRRTARPGRHPTSPGPVGTKEQLKQLLAQTELSRPQDAAGFWLYRAAQTYQREVDRAMAPLGLTHLQYIILVEIAWFGSQQDEVTQKDIVSLDTIHLAQVSAVVGKLQKNGLVEQRRSSRDSRARLLQLTKIGVTALRAALPIMAKLQRRLFDGPAGHAELVTLLGKLLEKWG